MIYNPRSYAEWHQFIERYVEWCGFSFTHLRPENAGGFREEVRGQVSVLNLPRSRRLRAERS
jgi:hypothetical protein